MFWDEEYEVQSATIYIFHDRWGFSRNELETHLAEELAKEVGHEPEFILCALKEPPHGFKTSKGLTLLEYDCLAIVVKE